MIEIAGLVFTCENEDDFVSQEDESDIKSRFTKILESFIIPDKHYASKTKTNNSLLPYNSGIRMKGTFCVEIGDFLVLHFTSSYLEPLLFMYNVKTFTICNYIHMRVAKRILDDDVYTAVFNGLHQRRIMDGMLKDVTNFDDFIKKYEEMRSEQKNQERKTGINCFSIKL